ncbi:uncharacterized [Tachysurus ichikawai]
MNVMKPTLLVQAAENLWMTKIRSCVVYCEIQHAREGEDGYKEEVDSGAELQVQVVGSTAAGGYAHNLGLHDKMKCAENPGP